MTTFDFSAEQQRQHQHEEAQREQSVSQEDSKGVCKYAKYGCAVRVSERECEEHEVEFLAAHLALVEDFAEEKDRELLKMQMESMSKAAAESFKDGRYKDMRRGGVCGTPKTTPVPDQRHRRWQRIFGDACGTSRRGECRGPGVLGFVFFLLLVCFLGGNWFLRIPMAIAMASIVFKVAMPLLPQHIAEAPARKCWFWIVAFLFWRFFPFIARTLRFILLGWM